MSKKPKKNHILWIVILVVIFAPGLLSGLLGLLSTPLFIGGLVALGIFLAKKAGKKHTTAQSTADAQVPLQAETPARKAPQLKKSIRAGVCKMLAIIGYSLAGLTGLSGVLTLVDSGFTDATDFVMMMAITAYFLLSGVCCHIASAVHHRREMDASRYAVLIGDRDSYSLAQLSATTSYSIPRVRRDLQRMIDKGVFGEEAYIDMARGAFMRCVQAEPFAETYTRNISEPATETAGHTPESASSEPEEELDMDDFGAILKKIRQLDDEIEDEAVSERIRRIEAVTGNIFDYVKDNPEKRPQIRMFLNYYLPTTLKLLSSYSRIERVGVAGQNMREAKENIEKILDMLVVGFEQQLDQLFGSESMDITSDIEVLEQMMKKDGLRENDDFVLRSDFDPDGYSDEITDELSDAIGSAAARDIRAGQ